MNQDWLNALYGGGIIGIAVSLMLLWNGRVTGISGIISGALSPVKGDTLWRWLFIAGLFLGGLFMIKINQHSSMNITESNDVTTILAGLLVGVGTVLGSGCTSGHGVCGISRMSPRSIIATLAFMAAGILAVVIYKKLGVY